MSAKSRWKYQQAQKQGFKPQIPDSSDEESTVIEPDVEQTPEGESVVVSRKKGGVFAFFAAIFLLIRRGTVSVFAKVRSFQKSYLASITAEGPKEEAVPLFPQKSEPSQEESLPSEDTLLARQIEATTRQLTELHQNLTAAPPEKEETVEEEMFDSDDFDEAVRKARMKLLTTAALVLFCIGGFCAYQFLPLRGSKENLATSEANNNEIIDPVPDEFEKDYGIPLPQSVKQLEQTPLVPVTQEISQLLETPLSDFDDPLDFTTGFTTDSTTVMSISPLDSFQEQEDSFEVTLDEIMLESPMDDWGGVSAESPQIQEDEFAVAPGDRESELTSPIATTLSLGPSQDTSEVTAQPSPGELRGEMDGVTITIADSPVADLPLPQSPDLAQRAMPAAPFAAQFQESLENNVLKGFGDEAPSVSAPKLVMPNQRYQDSVNAPAVSAPSSEPRRQRVLPLGPSPTQLPVQAVEAKTPSSPTTRQYTVQEDDNLFNIAQRELGDVTLWREIRRLNRDAIGNNAGYLTPGTVILLPE